MLAGLTDPTLRLGPFPRPVGLAAFPSTKIYQVRGKPQGDGYLTHRGSRRPSRSFDSRYFGLVRKDELTVARIIF